MTQCVAGWVDSWLAATDGIPALEGDSEARATAVTDYSLKTPVRHETWGLKVPDPRLVDGLVRRAHGDFSMGCVLQLSVHFLLLLFIPSRPIRLPSRMAERIKLTLSASQKNTTLSFPALSLPRARSPPAPCPRPRLQVPRLERREIDNLRGSTEMEFICDPSVAVGAVGAG
ncbi:hypothetical protein B0H14DRAFT_3425395 [Mycena olivaceomarginata]|nr:hypothetical protein B0H14DRAFT_3425395 [Mycena olivaceomarginata]